MWEQAKEFFSSQYFMPHGHCYLWRPDLLGLHFWSDMLIGGAYIVIASLLYLLVKKIRLPFSWVFIAFGLFIALCGGTHFMEVWTIWNPDYWSAGFVKAACAIASVATGIGLFFVRPQVIEVVNAARLSEERRIRLESTNAELEAMYRKVKELDDLKSQFFANVSHELRTPLTLIIGPADNLLAEPSLNDGQRQQLEVISRCSRALLRQVNDLLDIAKLEADKMQMQYAEIDAAAWWRLLASQFEVLAVTRKIDFTISAPEQLLAQVDTDKLERVAANLLSNAFKFVPEGGRIEARLSAQNDSLRLAVADSGPGVKEDMRTAIFERFRQAEGGATRMHGGTGLGLAIARDFVALHRGTIQVTENPGGGALFEVLIPQYAPAGAPVQSAPATLSMERPLSLDIVAAEFASRVGKIDAASPMRTELATLLLVEDNPEMRDYIASTLCTDYNIVVAGDGVEALDKLDASRPDIVISDIMMPRMSGDQFVAALRKRSEFDTVPVLMLTAKADDEIKIKLLTQGVQDYLIKPFLADELRARLANLLTTKRALETLRIALASTSLDLDVLAKQLAEKNRQLDTALTATAYARAQAEEASKVKGYFLGLISHEMRTPLSAMLMSLQVILREKSIELPPALKSKLNQLMNTARQMHDLVEGLLEYTRAQAGRLLARAEKMNVGQVVQETVDEYARFAHEKGITLRMESLPTALPSMISDPRLIKVLLGNLVSNAIKFTDKGEIAVSVAVSGQHYLLAVKDTGLGIPKEALHRIFEPFEQLEPVQRKTIPGAGLGLALVKHIVEALGGRIEAESEPGKGSTFRLRIPLQLPAQTLQVAPLLADS